MRLTVTVVSPATGRQADVAIDADPGSTLAQVAAELDRLMHGVSVAVPGPWVPALFVGGHRVPGDMRLAGSPLLDGCVVSLGDPSGCPRPEPTGVAELRAARPRTRFRWPTGPISRSPTRPSRRWRYG